MSIVISGATGLLGRAVFKHFKSSFSEPVKIVSLGFSRCDGEILKCDLTSHAELENLFNTEKPSIFIHCAAERRPDIVESGNPAAVGINITATKLLVEKCASSNCVLIFISTDYVFDGTKPPYTENSEPNPLNTYGLQKLEGEKCVLSNDRNIVVRVPVLYGPLNPKSGLDESAVTVLFKAVKSVGKDANMDNIAIRYPTLTSDIAKVLYKIVTLLLKEHSLGGVIHVSAGEAFTKYNMACIMARLFNLPSTHLVPDAKSTLSSGTKRPLNCQLQCDKLKSLGIDIPSTPFETGIKQCISPFI